MAIKKFKLDIFKVLSKIDKKDRNYYNLLTNEEKKAVSPLVIMRWLSGNGNPAVVYFLNEVVNPFVFSIGEHKKLLYNLLTIATQNDNRRFNWVPFKGNKQKSYNKITDVVAKYLNYPKKQAKEAISFFSDEDILDMGESIGFQKDEIQALKKELKTREK